MKKSKRSTAEQRKNMRADEEQRERIIKVKTILLGTNLVKKLTCASNYNIKEQKKIQRKLRFTRQGNQSILKHILYVKNENNV